MRCYCVAACVRAKIHIMRVLEKPTDFFTRDEIAKRGDNLDISWLKDDSVTDHADLPEPDVIAAEIVTQLQTALEEMQALQAELGGGA